jgi:oxygen-dependent protoporphyrinogen oxidase
MVLGVFAGDAKRISLPAAFPRMAALEATHGSLIRGMIAGRKERRARGGGGPAGPGGSLRSFTDGLQSLPRALAASGRFRVRTGTTVAGLARDGDGWRLKLTDGELLSADGVILAVEPRVTARLLADLAPAAAKVLMGIPVPPVTVAAFGYGRATRAALPTGFGMLVPRGEGARILGCLWDTHLFPGRSPEGSLLVRSMLGGAVDPQAAGLDDEAMIRLVRDDLARLLGVREEPEMVHIARWDRAIPQYEVGHLDRVTVVEAALQQLPGLFLAGNSLHGVSFGKTAAAGVTAARAARKHLAHNPTRA